MNTVKLVLELHSHESVFLLLGLKLSHPRLAVHGVVSVLLEAAPLRLYLVVRAGYGILANRHSDVSMLEGIARHWLPAHRDIVGVELKVLSSPVLADGPHVVLVLEVILRRDASFIEDIIVKVVAKTVCELFVVGVAGVSQAYNLLDDAVGLDGEVPLVVNLSLGVV